MTGNNRTTAGRRVAAKALAMASLLWLAACAAPGNGETDEHFVDLPDKWDRIDLAEADLTLPLTSPLEISALQKRVGEHQVYENLYTFHGITGYVLTSRVFFGHYSAKVSERLADSADFAQFAEDNPTLQRRDLELAKPRSFKHPQQRSRGFYSKALAENRHEDCFVARIGYLLVDYNSVKRQPGAVDTLVVAVLCSDDLDEAALLTLLGEIAVVENRDKFRRDLSRRGIGTI